MAHKIYVYGRDGYHRGGVWFTRPPRKYPDEEIYHSEALKMAEEAIANGQEVRVVDALDMMVAHHSGDSMLMPEGKTMAEVFAELR